MAQNSRKQPGGNCGRQGATQHLIRKRRASHPGCRSLGLNGLLLAALALPLIPQAGAADAPPRAAAKPVKLKRATAPELDCPPPPPLPSGADAAKGPVPFRDCADTPSMIRLQGGRFLMGEQGNTGTLYERPVREVLVGEFSIGQYEVTFDEWDQCVDAGGCLNPAEDEGWGRGNRPVINVSWVDAQQYVHWLSQKTGRTYRLPTEAEWEYAARAGSDTRYSWGDGSEWACSMANVLDLSGAELHPSWHWHASCNDNFPVTAPVGSFPPNRWGLYDINGNVWEWVQDCWHSDYTGAPTDSSAWTADGQCGKRVNRGGGWGNHPRTMRSASRDADSAEGHSNAMGFRVARSP